MSATVAGHGSEPAPALPVSTTKTALPAVLAANLDLLDDVPAGGDAAPSAADHETWASAIAQMGLTQGKAKDRARAAGWSQFAMCVLAYHHARDQNFTHAFGAGLLTKPVSNRPFFHAASALYGLDIQDAANSKRVNSKATQYDGLLRTLRTQGIRIEDLSLSRDSVQRLVAVIENAGGLNALERLKDDRKDPDDEPIELDAQQKASILLARAKVALQGGSDAEPRLVFVHKRADGTEEELRVPPSVVNAALASQAPTPPRTQALAEMLEVGGCVLPEPTDEPKNKASDPNYSRTEMRDDERQVVWSPCGLIIQSLLKADSGTVVVECRNHDTHIILGEAVQGHTRLLTQSRKRIEANILPRDRRKLFDAAVIATDKKTGVGLLQISSAAAGGSRKGVGVLLQRLSGNGFNEVAEDRLDLHAHCAMTRGAFQGFASAYVEKARKAVRDASKSKNGAAAIMPVTTIKLAASGATVFCAKADDVEKAIDGKTQGKGGIDVRLDDFTAFLTVYLAVFGEVITEVVCSVGDRVLAIEFGTTSAQYRVFIPQATSAGVRKDTFIKTLKRVEWPKGAALQPSA